MPIFQDPDRQRFYDLWSDDHARQERQERQQARESQSRDTTHGWGHVDCGCEAPGRDRELEYSRLQGDRDEFIQYLKRVETSRWFDRPVRTFLSFILLCCDDNGLERFKP